MHYYKHHIGDFRSGTANMTRQERWLYRDMLDVYYDKEVPLPTSVQDVCDQIGATDEEAHSVAKILRLKFNQTETGWVHNRCEAELESYRVNAEKARENGKKGGRPPKSTAKKTRRVSDGFPTGSQQDASGNPEQSGSQANHKPLTINHKPEEEHKAPPTGDAILFPDVDPQVVADFKALRKQKKAAITKTAMDDIAREAVKAGMTLEGALRICCTRGWSGFEASWIKQRSTDRANGAGSDKFRVANLDHSSSRAAMEASMKRHNIVVPDDDEIPF